MMCRRRDSVKPQVRATAWIWLHGADAPNPDLQAGGRGFESHRLHRESPGQSPARRPIWAARRVVSERVRGTAFRSTSVSVAWRVAAVPEAVREIVRVTPAVCV
jgi:hypothetical protein